jgi:hypothetical protein
MRRFQSFKAFVQHVNNVRKLSVLTNEFAAGGGCLQRNGDGDCQMQLSRFSSAALFHAKNWICCLMMDIGLTLLQELS